MTVSPFRKLIQSSTFWAGLFANVAAFQETGTTNPWLIGAAVLGYAMKEAGAKVGTALEESRNPLARRPR
jgi:hypothetical protein